MTENTWFLLALRSVAWNYNVTNFNSSNTFAYTLHNTSCFMTQNARKSSFRIKSIQTINISMTQCIWNNFYSYFTLFWRSNPNLLNFHWLLWGICNGCFTENWFSWLWFHLYYLYKLRYDISTIYMKFNYWFFNYWFFNYLLFFEN